MGSVWAVCLLALVLSNVTPLLANNVKERQATPRTTVPVPTADVLAWTRREIGAMFSFNMITFLVNGGVDFCGDAGLLPPPHWFYPEKLDVGQWVAAAVAFGARYAVLTAKHCSGFVLWPSDILEETGFDYTYSTLYSAPAGRQGYDIVKDFVEQCAKYGITPGFYYSLDENYYLNVHKGVVQTGDLVPGQANITQDMYGRIVLAQLNELWSNYGNVSEIWFDGGCTLPGDVCDEINLLLTQTQPHAVYFNGLIPNSIRWVGTESGMPDYPIWSTSQNYESGLGSPYGNVFCPAETDTTLTGVWFWEPNRAIRTLAELQQVYYHSVGQNTNLLLNVEANISGLVEDIYFSRYQEFGSWIANCFDQSVASTHGKGFMLELKSESEKPLVFNHVLISEDQSQGQLVLEFTVSALLTNSSEVPLVNGQSIGNKFIRNIEPVTASKVILFITDAFATPSFLQFSLHNC